MSEANKIKNPSDHKVSKAIGKMIRTSPIKLNDAIKNIRGKKVGDALSHLEFSKKRISNEAKKILESAIANAENNHGLDIDSLVVAEAFVGKNLVMKRSRARARGRGAQIGPGRLRLRQQGDRRLGCPGRHASNHGPPGIPYRPHLMSRMGSRWLRARIRGGRRHHPRLGPRDEDHQAQAAPGAYRRSHQGTLLCVPGRALQRRQRFRH